MRASNLTRADFIDQVLTSRIAGEVAKRFLFPTGVVGALYTMGQDPVSGKPQTVVLFVSTFPPTCRHGGFHDFGIDYQEQPVATSEEAEQLLAQFDREEAARFRTSCRPS